MNENKFHGISNPNELKKTWYNLTNRNPNEINVLWNPYEFDKYKDFNIINILYNEDEPDMIGHWCLLLKLDDNNIIFYNPINKPFFNDFLNLLCQKYNVLFDMTGKQKIGNKSCGYYCLHKLREYIFMKPITKYEFVEK